jgi:hypothetical protein
MPRDGKKLVSQRPNTNKGATKKGSGSGTSTPKKNQKPKSAGKKK